MVATQWQQFLLCTLSMEPYILSCMTSMITHSYRIKDSTSRKHLIQMSHAVNQVWNYCQSVSLLAWRRDKKYLSAYDLHALIKGTAKDLRLNTDSMQQVCTEYVTRKRQCRKHKLKWRSHKRSLGWIPFKARYVHLQDDTVTYCGLRLRFWRSRSLDGTLKTGSFTQDARGRWYVHFRCEVPDPVAPPGPTEIGIDLGLMEQVACTHLPEPLSRANLTRQYAKPLAMAQRAHKAKRVKALHAKIVNCRKDWTHKVTTAIARQASLIAVGNVSSRKLAKTRLAKSTYDAAWGFTRTLLKYKAIRLERRSTARSVKCAPVDTCSGVSYPDRTEWTEDNWG